MRSLLTFLLLACAAWTFTGCAFMSDEDRDFYGKGWVHPSELDKPMDHHAIPNPENPGNPESASNPPMANQGNAVDSGTWEDPMYPRQQ